MKREKGTSPKRILAKHLDGLKRNNFCDFDKPRKCACQKGKIESNEQNKKASQNEFMEKCGMPDRVKSFVEVNCNKNRPRAQPWFVKPNQSGMRKEQNFIQNRLSRVETGLEGREDGI